MSSLSALNSVSGFLQLLHSRRRESSTAPIALGSDEDQSLVFATALLRQALVEADKRALPLQLAVVGPTQSGKSSLVNLLLGTHAAESSPLAGYTRNPQGFSHEDLDENQASQLVRILGGWERHHPDEGEQVSAGSFSLQQVSSPHPLTMDNLVIWDTPDFDSINSRAYRDSVPVICALADIVVLVVSREKYADQSVWQLLRLIAPVGIPVLICLNKLLPAEESLVRASLTQRLEGESIQCEDILSLPYLPDEVALLEGAAAGVLREKITGLMTSGLRERSPALLRAFLTGHWEIWTAPLRRELDAIDVWRADVEEAIDEAIQIYQQDYLDNPHYSETLQRAVLQLLELLELPGIAAGLTRARKLLTWPMRKLHGFVRGQLDKSDGQTPNNETKILEDAVSHLLLKLQHHGAKRQLEEGSGPDRWWHALLTQLNAEDSLIRESSDETILSYQSTFELEVKEAGERLYRHLQAHPVTLNGLRAARVTTDVAAVALAVKSGGIGLHDLILTPAMLSFTSLLAEGAMGGYMRQVEKELKERQLAMVEELLFRGLLQQRLLALPERRPCDGCYDIPGERLREAEAALKDIGQ